MVCFYHINGIDFISAVKGGKVLELSSKSITDAFWELCSVFPQELIIWIDKRFTINLAKNLYDIFPHDLTMASYPIESQYFPETIGYIDQLPFVNPDYSVRYPTWRMSTDVGGIKGETAIKFRGIFHRIKDFGYLLNSIAKLGQQNSLFCYVDPAFVDKTFSGDLRYQASPADTFKFVSQFYKKEWIYVLFFCYWRYEQKLPTFSFLNGLKNKSIIKVKLDLEGIYKKNIGASNGFSVDVVIPTMGRPEYLKDVLRDFEDQTHKPSSVIVVEQNPDKSAQSQLSYLRGEKWSFEITHHFIHRIGACHARNLALKSVKADYIFFADDDIRFQPNLIETALREITRLKIGSLNLNCLQISGNTIFHKIKQWGTFASGASFVKSNYALNCDFSEVLEHGFGEDIDFGLKLRALGCDIIYHPNIEIRHLKAKTGGFREIQKLSTESKKITAKPSPTMMILVKKYYSKEMYRGYKLALFLKYYRNQSVKNPFRYLNLMKKKWRYSEVLALEILSSKGNKINSSHD